MVATDTKKAEKNAAMAEDNADKAEEKLGQINGQNQFIKNEIC